MVYVIIVAIGIIGIISTLFVAGNIDANYGKSTRRNMTNLIFIYTALFIVLDFSFFKENRCL